MNEEKKEELNSEELKKALDECEKIKAEYLAGWQRARADFLNFKKEEIERIEGLLRYAHEEFIFRLIPILDNFDLAEKNLPDDARNDKNIKGLLQIKSQVDNILKHQGVEEIKSIGEKFDPNYHEVISEAEGETEGIIVEVLQKGYMINGRVLRAAKVKIAK